VRFEVLSTDGVQREVEFGGGSVVAGRDPACDLFLDDSRCSRRHAIFEASPQGLSVRDNGSANGVFVNGRKIERSGLVVGDIVRLGETVLRVLAEEQPDGTLSMAPEEILDIEETEPLGRPSALGLPDRHAAPPAAATPGRPHHAVPPVPHAPPPHAAHPMARRPGPPPHLAHRPAPPPPPAPGPALEDYDSTEPSLLPEGRPLTVTLLAVLWLLTGIILGVAGIGAALFGHWQGATAGALAGAGLLYAMLGSLLGYGLWSLAPWARPLQIALSAVGVLVCPATLPSLLTLAYMLRPEAKAAFGEPLPEGRSLGESRETAFALGLLGSLLLSLALTAAVIYFGPGLFRASTPDASTELKVVNRLKRVQLAEQSFRNGVCHSAYGKLESLLRPAEHVPGFPADGPPFLTSEFENEIDRGFRFRLEVSDPVAATERCRAEGYRHFEYTATPVDGRGRHYSVSSDGVVRFADGRPVGVEDSAVP
jgi:hypothetical protein